MKRIIILIFLLCISGTISAQFLRGYGIKGGVSVSNIQWKYSDFDIKMDNKVGFVGGVFVEVMDLGLISFQADASYIQTGGVQKTPVTTAENPEGTGEYLEWTIDADYIALNIVCKARLPMDIVSPYLLIGPKVNFRISQNEKYEGPGIDVMNCIRSPEFDKTKFAVIGGIGTEISLADFALLAEFIYNFDLTNLYKNEFVKVTSNVMEFKVGVLL